MSTARNSARDRHAALMKDLDEETVAAAPAPASGGRTHPDSSVPALGTTGELMRQELQTARDQVAGLQRELEALRAAPAERQIPAKLIRHGKFRDRHALGFKDAKFEELKASIQKEGGNTQAVLVRPLAERDAEGHEFEAVWGHRRHIACLEAGMPVNVIVRELSDREAVALMTLENKLREGLSQFELAGKYKTWLVEGLFENQQAIADQEGLNQATISRIMAINDLPDELVERMDDPRKITGKWAAKVLAVVKKDRAGVLKRLSATSGKLTPKAAMDAILGAEMPSRPRDVVVGKQRVFRAMPTRGDDGEVTWSDLRLDVPLNEAQLEKLAAFLAKL